MGGWFMSHSEDGVSIEVGVPCHLAFFQWSIGMIQSLSIDSSYALQERLDSRDMKSTTASVQRISIGWSMRRRYIVMK